ncbi:hypothetical protein O8E94_003512 [Yersinia ruckeri]|nr:hypothetical protein [Yersinia ruckeri]
MVYLYSPTERIIITSIINVNIMLCIERNDFYKNDEYKNAIILADPVNGGFFFDTIKEIGYFNEGSISSLMYTLLVFPYESIRNGGYHSYDNALDEINNDIISRKEMYGYKLIKSNYKTDGDKNPNGQHKGERNILSHIRNAVSHASISLEDDYFIFSDINPYSKKEVNNKIIFKFHKNNMGFLIEKILNALMLVVKQIQQREAERKLHG